VPSSLVWWATRTAEKVRIGRLQLEELGTPVRVESYASVAGIGHEPLVVSTVTELKLGHAGSGEFEVPSDYHDLRDVQGLAAQLGPRGFQGGQRAPVGPCVPDRIKGRRAGTEHAATRGPTDVAYQFLAGTDSTMPSLYISRPDRRDYDQGFYERFEHS